MDVKIDGIMYSAKYQDILVQNLPGCLDLALDPSKTNDQINKMIF